MWKLYSTFILTWVLSRIKKINDQNCQIQAFRIKSKKVINTGPKQYLQRKAAALLMLDKNKSRLERIIGYWMSAEITGQNSGAALRTSLTGSSQSFFGLWTVKRLALHSLFLALGPTGGWATVGPRLGQTKLFQKQTAYAATWCSQVLVNKRKHKTCCNGIYRTISWVWGIYTQLL